MQCSLCFNKAVFPKPTIELILLLFSESPNLPSFRTLNSLSNERVLSTTSQSCKHLTTIPDSKCTNYKNVLEQILPGAAI